MASNDSLNPQQGTRRQMGQTKPPGGSTPPDPNGAASTPADPTPTAHEGSAAVAETLLMSDAALSELHKSLRLMDVFVNQRYMNQLSLAGKVQPLATGIDRSNICVFKLSRLVYSQNEDFFEKLVSLYSAMNSWGGMLGMILRGDESHTDVYLCTASGGTGAKLLQANLDGQFYGSEFEKLSQSEAETLLNGVMYTSPSGEKVVRSVSMIPGQREDERKNSQLKFSAQGFENFIDAMSGSCYTVVILAQAMNADVVDSVKSGYEALYTLLSSFAKENVTYAENGTETKTFSLASNFSKSITENVSSTYGTSHTTNINRGYSDHNGSSTNLFGVNFNSGSASNHGIGVSDGINSGGQRGKAIADVQGGGTNGGFSNTSGWTRTVNLSREIKGVQGCMELLAQNIKRIDASRSFGMWSCCCYVITDDVSTASVASSVLTSLIGGDTQSACHVYTNQWELSGKQSDTRNLLQSLSYLRHPEIEILPQLDGSPLSIESQRVTPGLMLSGRELPTLMRLPQRSVSGMVVDTIAEFARNLPANWEKPGKRYIRFGNIVHMGKLERSSISIDLDAMSSHVFITGASGSGKSNTTYNLLEELIKKGINFLVIEPVKGEYKVEFAGLPKVRIFTTKPDAYRMLQLNPFEFNPNVHIREHLSRLLSVVSACWPLYGPMPAMLKEAFEEAYISCGWDLELSVQVVKTGRQFPTFADVLPEIERIINESAYSSDGKGDFKGALVTRVKSLLNGFEGQIFGCRMGVSEDELFNGRTIVDLSSIGSSESRSLIMGMLVIKLREYRMVMHERALRSGAASGGKLQHLTVLEEAHSIFPRCSQDTNQESGNVQGASVGLLVDCVAELRSSGEGFMIIDQSPSKVDEAAIKNTAIKIVMRLSEKEDCEAMANALSLNEEQMRTLSRLDVGVAAVYHVGWQETVLAKMGSVWDPKKYRKETKSVNPAELVKARSGIVQWLYDKCAKKQFEELNTTNAEAYMEELKDALPTVNKSHWQDMKARLNAYFVELKAVRAAGGRSQSANITSLTARFLYEFLQLEGLFRVIKPPVSRKRMGDELNDREKACVAAWYEKLVNASPNYIYMPEKAEETVWNPGKAKEAEYFNQIMGLIVQWEWKRRMASDGNDYSMSLAYNHLKKLKRFS